MQGDRHEDLLGPVRRRQVQAERGAEARLTQGGGGSPRKKGTHSEGGVGLISSTRPHPAGCGQGAVPILSDLL
jgi:hypothetical protein